MDDKSLANLGINYSRSFPVILLRTPAQVTLRLGGVGGVEIAPGLSVLRGVSRRQCHGRRGKAEGSGSVFDCVASGGILGAGTKVGLSQGDDPSS